MLWWILFAVILIYLTIKIYNSVYYWERKGVTHVKPWPLLGNFGETTLKKLTLVEQIQKLYNRYPDAKFVGLQQFNMPVVMIRDLELIKQVLVKDFDHFVDHTVIFTEDMDPLLGKNLVSLKGQRWRDMRATLSPAFTGSKMRTMYSLIKESAEKFTQYFLDEESQKKTLTLEMKDIFTKYTNDIIATCAFGITCNSLKEPENEFYASGKRLFTFRILGLIKAFAFIFIPKIMKTLGITLISEDKVGRFFRSIIKKTVEIREREGTVRPDMIHLLMEAKKGKLKHEVKEINEDSGFATVQESDVGKQENSTKPELTNEDITAQALLFFLAGYETSSVLMCFLAHELAVNPDIQQKLQEEIDATFEKCNGNIDYESLVKMKYLDMVISECLRKWPPGVLTERLCTKPYVLKQNSEVLHLEKDASIWVPTYCLHHDPKYYSDPEKFDPERFNDENKNSIVPFAYLPFGSGPRNCIGSRFALLEVKTLFVNLLSKFNIVVVEKTQVPLKLAKGPSAVSAMAAEKGFWLGFKSR